ncbi:MULTISPECIES: hypothetical protein [Bacillus]|uniref:hypothetical protein n=1 Tax=Bacillus TaxID=1386 RepID=UPI000BB966BB|nr:MULTISPECIES: hypothetical protein [Bacillus]
MNKESYDYQSNLRNIHDECKKYMSYHVTITMVDGSALDGIIENVDMDNVTVLAGEDVMEKESEYETDSRQYYGSYGRPRRRYRRYRRQRFPLASLAALALLPYILPQPYPYHPYY